MQSSGDRRDPAKALGMSDQMLAHRDHLNRARQGSNYPMLALAISASVVRPGLYERVLTPRPRVREVVTDAGRSPE